MNRKPSPRETRMAFTAWTAVVQLLRNNPDPAQVPNFLEQLIYNYALLEATEVDSRNPPPVILSLDSQYRQNPRLFQASALASYQQAKEEALRSILQESEALLQDPNSDWAVALQHNLRLHPHWPKIPLDSPIERIGLTYSPKRQHSPSHYY